MTIKIFIIKMDVILIAKFKKILFVRLMTQVSAFYISTLINSLLIMFLEFLVKTRESFAILLSLYMKLYRKLTGQSSSNLTFPQQPLNHLNCNFLIRHQRVKFLLQFLTPKSLKILISQLI